MPPQEWIKEITPPTSFADSEDTRPKKTQIHWCFRKLFHPQLYPHQNFLMNRNKKTLYFLCVCYLIIKEATKFSLLCLNVHDPRTNYKFLHSFFSQLDTIFEHPFFFFNIFFLLVGLNPEVLHTCLKISVFTLLFLWQNHLSYFLCAFGAGSQHRIQKYISFIGKIVILIRYLN